MEGDVFLNIDRFVCREIPFSTNTNVLAFYWKQGVTRLYFFLGNEVQVRWIVFTKVGGFINYVIGFYHSLIVLKHKKYISNPINWLIRK